MIVTLGAAPIYTGHVAEYRKHMTLLEPFINDDQFWRQTTEWQSRTISTMGHEKNFDLPWDEILKDLEPHIQEYLKIFQPNRQFTYQARPWLNRYEKGGWQEQHNHLGAASHFSLAYMLDCQEQSNFVFVDDPGNWYDNLWDIQTMFNNWPHRNFTPDQTDGTLLIFPCATDHYVQPNTSENYRISASANIFIQEIENEQ